MLEIRSGVDSYDVAETSAVLVPRSRIDVVSFEAECATISIVAAVLLASYN